MVENSVATVNDLISLGVKFDRDDYGKIHLSVEGGHSRDRIVHHKDNTGEIIVTALLEKVKSRKNITAVENARVLRLEEQDGLFCAEVRQVLDTVKPVKLTSEMNSLDRSSFAYYASKTCVIATGGIGQVYMNTTNSEISTGDGIYFARRLGAEVEKMSLIQFHPTAFDGGKLLITEAVRGFGGHLLNKDFERFTKELEPRDIVSKSIMDEQKRQDCKRFYLSVSHLDSDEIKSNFPMIYERLLKRGYDLTKQPIPIYPCQHYLMGGITVDSRGKTTVDGLYAVGECSHTGVHGSNRLASNSLLEALVFSKSAADDINANVEVPTEYDDTVELDLFTDSDTVANLKSSPPNFRAEIKSIMQDCFFVTPNYAKSKDGFMRIAKIREVLDSGEYPLTPESAEVKSLAEVAYLILGEVVKSVS